MITVSISLLAAVVLYVVVKRYSKKQVPLKGGDLVLLRPSYMKEYPDLPKDYPMHVEKLENNYAIVVFMHTNNREMCQTKVLLPALRKVS